MFVGAVPEIMPLRTEALVANAGPRRLSALRPPASG
jgi:hypothetical protein